MPNWCSNTITLEGKKENLKAFLMNAYVQYKIRTVDDVFKLHSQNEMYCFGASCQQILFEELNSETINNFEDTTLNIQYETRWSPNVSDTLEVAKIFHLNLEHEYEELGMGIYGKAEYDFETDVYHETNLTDDEIAECTDDEGFQDYDKLQSILDKKVYV